MTRIAPCPCCERGPIETFYRLDSVPVQSNILFDTREEAVAIARGRLHLAVCSECGFVHNTAFDPATQELSERYEVTQGFSGRFNAFLEELARRLVERYAIRGKRVVEIGCGAGEFLAALCAIGGNHGIGIDPATDPSRMPPSGAIDLTFLRERWSPAHRLLAPDVLCCRHTLEHLGEPRRFVESVRAALGDRAEVVVFFEVPDARRILDMGAFWDVYYEHFGYFAAEPFARVFAECGFEIVEEERIFDGQYLALVARPSVASATAPTRATVDDGAGVLVESARRFAHAAEDAAATWRRRLGTARRAALWGSGSKAVAFLSGVGPAPTIDCIVDVNPFRQGKHSPGTGHRIVAPADLTKRDPDLVIVMNPIYREEIERRLRADGVRCEVATVADARPA